MLRPSELRCVFSRGSGSSTIEVPPPETSATRTSSWRAVVRVLRSSGDAAACALLPSGCALCGSLLPRLSLAPICDACWMEISVQSGNDCVRCGDPLPEAGGGREAVCRACRMVPPDFERAVACGPYEGRMRSAIHALKYRRMYPAARRMGELLAAAIAKLANEAPNELLMVPVPLHRSKQADRGFNQARLLAVHALKALGRTHPDWKLRLAPSTLMRLRATGTQAGLTPRQRRINVRGAFQVADPAAVRGKHILLVDDILTTGATARAASKTLKRAGAATVWVATLARAGRAELHGERVSRRESAAGIESGPAVAG